MRAHGARAGPFDSGANRVVPASRADRYAQETSLQVGVVHADAFAFPSRRFGQGD